jgi:hypothetical protein
MTLAMDFNPFLLGRSGRPKGTLEKSDPHAASLSPGAIFRATLASYRRAAWARKAGSTEHKPLRLSAAPAAGSMCQPHEKPPAASAPAIPTRHVVSAGRRDERLAEQNRLRLRIRDCPRQRTFSSPADRADNRIDVDDPNVKVGRVRNLCMRQAPEGVCRTPTQRRCVSPIARRGRRIRLAAAP